MNRVQDEADWCKYQLKLLGKDRDCNCWIVCTDKCKLKQESKCLAEAKDVITLSG
jgi:hypothetical protein